MGFKHGRKEAISTLDLPGPDLEAGRPGGQGAQSLRRRLETPVWMLGQERLNHLPVLPRMHRAGGVNQPTGRSHQGRHTPQQLALQLDQGIDRPRVDAPAGIGMAGQGTQTGAGSIQQHPIKGADPGRLRLGKVHGVRHP